MKGGIQDRSATNHRLNPESDFIWGINAVLEALTSRPGTVAEVSVQKGKAGARIQQLVDMAREHRVKLRFVDPQRLGVPKKCAHQGVVARLAATELVPLEDFLSMLQQQQEHAPCSVLVLDSLQDPHNLGSILRSALAAGFHHVLLTRERSAPLGGTAAKISAGAVAHLQICQVSNLTDALQKLKAAGFWVFGAVAGQQDAVSLYEADFSGPLCLVIGSESKGIRPLVQKQCDQLVTIPMDGNFNSLNASVAAAVIMFEMRRQERARL